MMLSLMGMFGYPGGTMMDGGFPGSLGLLSSLVWLVVGILAAIWLWQHISK